MLHGDAGEACSNKSAALAWHEGTCARRPGGARCPFLNSQLQTALLHGTALLQGRLWWRDAHLLPQPADTVAEALESGAASPAALLVLAAVNAFLHPLWQRQVVQQWR